MELVYNHIETSSDGSQLFCQQVNGINRPPFRDTYKAVDKVKDVAFRREDVVFLTQPKSGTHWVANIVNLLLHKEYLEQETWPLEYFFLEIHDQTTYINAPSPRIFMTHMTMDLPLDAIISSRAKIVTLTRNPKDAFLSFYLHTVKIGAFKGTMEGLAELMFQGRMGFTHQPLERQKLYQQIKTDYQDGCLSLTFEQLKQEPRSYVRLLAHHVGVDVTDEEISKILDKTSVEKMTEMVKGHQDTFLGKLGMSIYRKGKIGDWKNHFTVAFNEWFDEQSEIVAHTSGCVSSAN